MGWRAAAVVAAAVGCVAVCGGEREGVGAVAGRLGSKSPYDDRVIRDEHAEPEMCHSERECKAVHMYKVVRHGTRYPTLKHTKKMAALAEWFGEIGWDIPFREDDAGLLAPRGEDELFQMGRRTRERFPELFEEAYHPLRFDFRSSQVTRALQSATAFAHGLFHQEEDKRYEHVAISSETKAQDTQLRFHKACPAYKTKVKSNEELKEKGEPTLLAAKTYASIYPSLLERLEALGARNIAERLQSENVPAENIVPLVWDVCMMDSAVYNRTSKWCTLLTETSVHMLEYLDDVSGFWLKGYGFPINYEMSCLLVGDILNTTLVAAQSYREAPTTTKTTKRKATFRFAHAETLVPLIARLGLFQDPFGHASYLASHNIDSPQVLDRRWRMGAVAPFAANIAVVLHACVTEDSPDESSESFGSADTMATELMVEILHNEHPIHLPDSLCPGRAPNDTTSTLCRLDVLARAVAEQAGPCDFDSICERGEQSS